MRLLLSRYELSQQLSECLAGLEDALPSSLLSWLWVGSLNPLPVDLVTGLSECPNRLLGFPSGSDGKESMCNAGDLGSISGLGRSPGEGKGYPLQYSGLENSMDCILYGVMKSRTRLSNFHFQ